MTVELEAELNRLYQAPLADFVAQRNQLARALKQAGAKSEAERVSKLVRPSPVAWVINQLHFRQGDALNALMDSGASLKRAQEELAAADEFADCKSAHQQALRIATEAAVIIAEESGMAMNAGLRRRLELALAVLSARVGTGLAPLGRMSAEPEPAGFDAFSTSETSEASLTARPSSRGAPDAGAAQAKAKQDALEAARAAFAAIEQELGRLEEDARAAHERYEAAAHVAAEAEKRADAARRVRDEARRESEAAKTKADEVRGQLARLR